MTDRQAVLDAIRALDDQRATIGDGAVDAAVIALRQQLDDLDVAERGTARAPRRTPSAPSSPSPSSPPSGPEERRLVTILFADIDDFTRLATRMEPETLRELTNAAFACLVASVQRYDGSVDSFIGDRVMALFGTPTAHDDDAARAVRCALEMRSELSAFSEARGIDLGLHLGINTGRVVVGAIGGAGRWQRSVLGDAVNVASRLADASQRGQVVLGEATQRLVQGQFETVVLGPMKLKGKAERVPAYAVVRSRDGVPGHVRRPRLDLRAPMIGRESERTLLQGSIDELATGRGGAVHIEGEAGVGKTRLLQETRLAAARDASAGDVQWLHGQTLSYGRQLEFWPFREALRRFSGIRERDGADVEWRKLSSALRDRVGDEGASVLPYIASLLGTPVPADLRDNVRYLDGEALGRRVFWAMRRFLELLASLQPVVLVVEDLHWIDDSSEQLLRHLLPLVRRRPLLLITTNRPGAGTEGTRYLRAAAELPEALATPVRLEPLSATQMRTLAERLLPADGLTTHEWRTIAARSGGNAFFLEEVIRSLIDTEAVRPTADGRWRATARIRDYDIPESVQSVVTARIDLLPEGSRRILRMAAVIGRVFPHPVLAAVAEDDDLEAHLARLEQHGLIMSRSVNGEPGFAFRHALAHEVAYDGLLRADQIALHGQIGRAMEALYPEDGELHGHLAHHFAAAEEWRRAETHLIAAGSQAGRLAADTEALAHFQRALRAMSMATDDALDPMQQARIERGIGEALMRRGEHDRALEHFRRAHEAIGRPIPDGEQTLRLATLRELLVQASHVLAPFTLPRPRADVAPEMEEEFHLLTSVLWIFAFRDVARFVYLTLRLLNRSERQGYAYGIAFSNSGVGTTFTFLRRFRIAERFHRRAVDMAEQLDHPLALGTACYTYGVHRAYVGDLERAVALAGRSAGHYHAIGHVRGWASSALTSAVCLAHLGRIQAASGLAEALLRYGEDSGDPQVRCWGLHMLGIVARYQGRLERAVRRQREAIGEARQLSDHFTQVAGGGELVHALTRLSALDEARAAQTTAERVAGEHPVPAYATSRLANATTELALARASASSAGDGPQNVAAARTTARSALRQARGYRPAEPEASRLLAGALWQAGDRRGARRRWDEAMRGARELGMGYEEALVLHVRGRQLHDDEDELRAEALGDAMGVTWRQAW